MRPGLTEASIGFSQRDFYTRRCAPGRVGVPRRSDPEHLATFRRRLGIYNVPPPVVRPRWMRPLGSARDGDTRWKKNFENPPPPRGRNCGMLSSPRRPVCGDVCRPCYIVGFSVFRLATASGMILDVASASADACSRGRTRTRAPVLAAAFSSILHFRGKPRIRRSRCTYPLGPVIGTRHYSFARQQLSGDEGVKWPGVPAGTQTRLRNGTWSSRGFFPHGWFPRAFRRRLWITLWGGIATGGRVNCSRPALSVTDTKDSILRPNRYSVVSAVDTLEMRPWPRRKTYFAPARARQSVAAVLGRPAGIARRCRTARPNGAARKTIATSIPNP